MPTQTITIPGEKKLEPPPRQVIVERMPSSTTTPQDVIVERWLSYPQQKRNIVYEKATQSHENLAYKVPQNYIIDWETTSHIVEDTTHTSEYMSASPPNIIIDWETNQANDLSSNVNNHVTFLGVEEADPTEYANIHSQELIDSHKIPRLVNDYKTPQEEVLASNLTSNEYILTGDVDALKYLNTEDLNKYLLTKF